LVDRVADRRLRVGDGHVAAFDGDLADYRRHLLERARDARRGDGGRSEKRREDRRRAAAEARAQLAPLQKAVQQAEKRLADLHARQALMASRLADPALYRGPAGKATALQRDKAELDRATAAAEAEWLAAAEALEVASAG
ncbi:MAG: ABC transporter ATP-binding protein, partial [Magnetospirillum sp.]|nr:ABC transporter ATP-binding protein [Magnetospirillum sp.]